MVQRLPIPAARLVSSRDHLVPSQLRVTELWFEVPLDYTKPYGPWIKLFARHASKSSSRGLTKPTQDEAPNSGSTTPRRYMVYLEGGPGFGNREPQDLPLTHFAIERGYQMLYLDHRGTGLSTPVSAEMLARLPGGVASQVEYLKLMRQDNTVRDCEAVRKYLTRGWPDQEAKWTTFGQSYGGFVSMSYLSMHPEGLQEVFLTGGLAPVLKIADEVYESLFPRVARRNKAYYSKFPEDVDAVRQIAQYVESQGNVALPSGGALTVPRLLTLGISFGMHGGFDTVHNVILHLKASLDQFGFLSRASLVPLETHTAFDTNIIYAILHEAIYCDGPGNASNWAAQRVGQDHPAFPWLKPDTSVAELDDPLCFSGENIFPFQFETYPELAQLQEAAHQLAAFDEWPRLYDTDQLKRNEVPVYAASYVEDMYVDADMARETAGLVQGTTVFETNVLYHNAVRAKPEEVLRVLFSLKLDVLD
jgi:pimeloyl-ACP methyl ester carboxylesterase